jgi:hypothetical protein
MDVKINLIVASILKVNFMERPLYQHISTHFEWAKKLLLSAKYVRAQQI